MYKEIHHYYIVIIIALSHNMEDPNPFDIFSTKDSCILTPRHSVIKYGPLVALQVIALTPFESSVIKWRISTSSLRRLKEQFFLAIEATVLCSAFTLGCIEFKTNAVTDQLLSKTFALFLC